MSHTCDAIVVCCIDFRFQKFIRNWTDQNLPDKTFDLVGFAGSTRNLDTIMGQIDISVRLHHISEAILIHHEECGAYGAESSLEKHTADLKKASAAIHAAYPDLKVTTLHVGLDGTFTSISE